MKTIMKNKKKTIVFILLLAFFMTPFFFSKYVTDLYDKIIIAIRQPQFTILFHSNNGESETIEQSITYGSNQLLRKNTFTNGNYSFVGWNTEEDASGEFYNDEQRADKITGVENETVDLYAVWSKSIIKSWASNATTDFHSNTMKSQITEIEFVDLYQVEAPEINNTTCWDVSRDSDESVIAWFDSGKLYIGGEGGVMANPDSSYLFYNFTNLVSINFSNNYNTVGATNMSSMFRNCTKLESLDLSSFNTSNVTNMSYLFGGRLINNNQTKMKLSNIDISSFDTSNVEDMSYMFFNCNEFTELDLSHFNTSNVTNMQSMFDMSESPKLETITLGEEWDTSKVTNMSYMFADCNKLQKIYVYEDFDTSSLTTSASMFVAASRIIGGYGTVYNSNKTSAEYARINHDGIKGYFTDVRGNDTTISGEMGYVTDGLLLHFDGIQNTLEGHDANATVWEDLTQSGYNGILKNGPTWRDSYLKFDGSDDWVNINEINLDNLTIEAVVEYSFSSATAEREIAVNYQNGGYGLSISNYSPSSYNRNCFVINVSGYGYSAVASDNLFLPSVLYSLSGSYDGNVLNLFENNTKYSVEKVGTVTKTTKNTNFVLGGDPSGEGIAGNYTALKLYSLRIYDRALTDEEVQQNYIVDNERFFVEAIKPVIKPWGNKPTTDFHASTVRDTITEIEFVDLNEVDAPTINNTNSWDVSYAGNESVIAWLVGTKLYIGGHGGVVANENSSYAFYNFANLETIIFNDLYYTEEATQMTYMFANDKKLNGLDLSSFDTKNVTNMSYMFSSVGDHTSITTFSLSGIATWDVKKVTNMSFMFSRLGYYATTWDISNLQNWETINVTNMAHMFEAAGYTATTWKISGISSWDTNKLTTTSYMFSGAGYSATTWTMENLSHWDTSLVTDMGYMFNTAGYVATSWAIEGLEDWNVEKVTTMTYMFSQAGYSAATWSIGDLTNWNPKVASVMSYMFNGAGYNASTSLESIGTLKVYATNVGRLFQNARYMKADVIFVNNPTSYTSTFAGSATTGDSLITVKINCGTYNYENILATKSTNSNVVYGGGLGVCTTNVIVNDGTADEDSKTVEANHDISYTITPDIPGNAPTVQCTNNQSRNIVGNTLSILNVVLNTTCTVYYEDATVLYTDGTFVINENTSDRDNNINEHGDYIKVYPPLSDTTKYVFADGNGVLWASEKQKIKKVEIGQVIQPTSTAYWFSDCNNLMDGDFENLDTSSVTSMAYMFNNAGNASGNTGTFSLRNMENWDTSHVTTMSYMFYQVGYYAKTWSIGDLSNWNLQSVTAMNYAFSGAGYSASTSLESIGTLDIYATNIAKLFRNARYMKATVNLYSNPASGNSGYSNAFTTAATMSGSLITVNFSCSTYNIDSVIATKTANSNVVKGSGIGICTVNVVVDDGTVDEDSKTVEANHDITFTINPTTEGDIPVERCTNKQESSITDDTLTISNVNLNTTCYVYYKTATLLYSDETLIINEAVEDRENNRNTHGNVVKVYQPLSEMDPYVFNAATEVLWYNDGASISKVIIGQTTTPTSTAYWFQDITRLSEGDFTKLDTSSVTTMVNMFANAGNVSGNTSFVLTGLDNWNTSSVTNMASMFSSAGYNANVRWSIGDLSNWDTSQVTNMSNMFANAGNASTNAAFESIGTLKIYATNTYRMFYYARNMKATINFYSNPGSGTSGYGGTFSNASVVSGSLITVNYSSNTTNIDSIIATKSASSNVVKGVLLE